MTVSPIGFRHNLRLLTAPAHAQARGVRPDLLVLSQSHNCSLFTTALSAASAELLARRLRRGAVVIGALEQLHTCHQATTVLPLNSNFETTGTVRDEGHGGFRSWSSSHISFGWNAETLSLTVWEGFTLAVSAECDLAMPQGLVSIRK